ncbi:S8 family serine peptidase [Microbacterium sp. gxy059]|uniref:S8 family serine peptidase n=1 Tax=Microbacterium sp. gxy059 TaxID=2957199 RepID=UPI003D953285
MLIALALACVIALPASASAQADVEQQAPASTPSPTPSPSPSPDDEEEDEEDPERAREYWLEEYGIADAWETTRGEGVRIAVIDSGVASDIPELDDAVVGGADMSGVGDPEGRMPLGDNALTRSHGTYVASVAASRGLPDDAGMIGVAPEAEVLAISLGFGSVSEVPFSDQVADAIHWAVDNGADVINLSFTINQPTWGESWDEAFLYAMEHDVVVIAAAGNRDSGTNIVGAPATMPGVLVVGGVDREGRASQGASTQGVTIGVTAPSEHLRGISPSGQVNEWNGTSGAAPIVSGIAALVRSAHPDLDAGNVINRILQTASPPPREYDGRDPLYGFGLVDAQAAVEADVEAVDKNPAQELRQWITLNRSGEISNDAEPAPAPEPVEIPALPPPDPPAEAGSPLVPSSDSLREVTLPLVALSVAGILIVLGVVAVSRRIRSVRAQHARTGS